MNFKSSLEIMGKQARLATQALALMTTHEKNHLLESIARHILVQKSEILNANRLDIEAAENLNLNQAMIDRLRLDSKRLDSIVTAVRKVAQLTDPVGRTDKEITLPNQLLLKKVRVPIGVIGIIYESRPEVTIDAATLCLKAGNAVILRGGKEAVNSNRALASAMTAGIKACGGNEYIAQLIPWVNRKAVLEMLLLSSYINLIIPRGGESLIHFVSEHSKIPVIKHYKGVCHVYVDEFADFEMAVNIIENAKCQRPGVCNAIEKVLIHKNIANEFVPKLSSMLIDRQVELRGDPAFCQISSAAKSASENDWYEEYLDLILTVAIVDDIDVAIKHINHYGSGHSDAIISDNQSACERFIAAVDSAVVYVNASTRFTDGGQFGMGAEIGISTDRLHARGPMGLEELTTYKYIVIGQGQIRT